MFEGEAEDRREIARIHVRPEEAARRERILAVRVEAALILVGQDDGGRADRDDAHAAAAVKTVQNLLARDLGERIGVLREGAMLLVHGEVVGREVAIAEVEAEMIDARRVDHAADTERVARLADVVGPLGVLVEDDLRGVAHRVRDRGDMHHGVRAREGADQFAHIGGVRLDELDARLRLLRRGARRVNDFVAMLREVQADEMADPAAAPGNNDFHGRMLLSVLSGQRAVKEFVCALPRHWECIICRLLPAARSQCYTSLLQTHASA